VALEGEGEYEILEDEYRTLEDEYETLEDEYGIYDRYANKFAPLDSMAIYPKPGHQLLYTPMTGEIKCPRLYLCLAHSISSPLMSMQHMHQHDQQ
jgi:hypothetical protein